MKRWLAVLVLVALGAIPVGLLLAQAARALQPYESTKEQAERFFAEGSYARARELYEKVDRSALSTPEQRWVTFRLADAAWRAEASNPTVDDTKLNAAREALESFIADSEKRELRDRLWAEAHESLGDFWWSREGSGNWGAAWPHYSVALDYWAGSDDLDLARSRYLGVVWKLSFPPWNHDYYGNSWWSQSIPTDVLENALKIAKSDNDRARAAYLLATRYANGGAPEQMERVAEYYDIALRTGKTTDWYDDALFTYAQWLERAGRMEQGDDGNWRFSPDYVKALSVYRRITSEFKKGETAYYDQASQRITEITTPAVAVNVSNVFLPGSEIGFNAGWRNVPEIRFDLYSVDLIDDTKIASQGDLNSWIQKIDVGRAKLVDSWKREGEDKGDYVPHSAEVRVEKKLTPGAYVVVASAGVKTARELILVTDTAVVLRSSPTTSIVYVANAFTGAPVANARVRLWQQFYDNGQHVVSLDGTTDSDGLARFNTNRPNYVQLFAAAVKGDREAFAHGNQNSYGRQQGSWKVYAYTDRPAYRPEETVQWKITARTYDGAVYSTPAGQTIEYEITDPRGSKITSGKAKLNAFGSFWSSLDLTTSMPLGVYRVTFWNEGRTSHIGNATLFRLEEYKLPEFKVSVSTAEEKGRKKNFRAGDRVEATIQSEYYFGGPVANAEVKVVVRQRPYYSWWHPTREFEWYFTEDAQGRQSYWYGEGQVVLEQTLKTDAEGKASVSFDTPRNQDLEYTIEASVTDASRREVTASGTVNVTQRRYSVHLTPQHYIHHPDEPVKVDVQAIDSNDQPVKTDGEIKVTRERWFEVWISPEGKQVSGDELVKAKKRYPLFPPPPDEGEEAWRLKSSGYQHDELFTKKVSTDSEGHAEFQFTPDRDGYYQLQWTSDDRLDKSKKLLPSDIVTAATSVWVATNATIDTGYHAGGIEVIVDKESIKPGSKVPVMIVSPSNDRWVLFDVGADDFYDVRLLHLDGTAKLVELPLNEKHIPNVFLTATSIADRQLFTATKEIIVPPVQQFLDVSVTPDTKEYLPRDKGRFTVTTRDAQGRPVSAEVALGVVDESIYAIQSDYAGDPRQFFYGSKRQNQLTLTSSFNEKQYVRFVLGKKKKELVDDRYLDRDEKKDENGVEGGVVGGVVGGLPSSRSMMQKASAVAESITMTASAPMMDAMQEVRAMNAPPAPAAPPPQAGGEPAVVVRNDFRSTIVWQPDIVTAANGQATVDVTYPDSLTTWITSARAASSASQFGIGYTPTVTRMPLIVRLEGPRFFVVGDRVTLSAVINNNTGEAMSVTPKLEAEGVELVSGTTAALTVPANGDARADWVVSVKSAGTAKLRVSARGTKYADAMEKSFVVYEHGIDKFLSKSGKSRSDDTIVRLELPKERRSTQMSVQVSPSIAVTMLDALPYLIDYPYGCTEQTMSRFLPAAIVSKTLSDLGISRELVASRIFGGIEQSTAAETHRDGKRDLARLDDITKKGLARLYDFQHNDGGWGWWKEGDSDPYMTAYVVWGLALARDGGISVRAEVVRRGADFLRNHLVERENDFDTQAWMLHALAEESESQAGEYETKAIENVWKNKDRLRPYSKALFAIALSDYRMNDRAQVLVRNLENGVKVDKSPDQSVVIGKSGSSDATVMGTAHWGEDGFWWRWSDGPVESTAMVLRALMKIDPKNALVEPSMNWLVKNRRGAQWSNTKDTAISILSLNEYLRASGELGSAMTYEVSVNGTSIATKKITAPDVFSAPSRFVVPSSAIRDGVNEVRIRRTSGNGPVYFAAEAKFFSLEEPVKAAGNELFVRRDYYRIVAKPTLLKGFTYDKVLMKDGESLASGDRVEVVLTIETKNDYEYLLFEDLKPAGLEAVGVRSGESLFATELREGAFEKKKETSSGRRINVPSDSQTGRTRWIYQELRDRKVAMFADKLPQGVWQIRYSLRAEVPGSFHALPLLGQAMYVPEIRANSDEIRIMVTER